MRNEATPSYVSILSNVATHNQLVLEYDAVNEAKFRIYSS
jgi:hypothetical protein